MKKTIALILALCMLCACTIVLAAESKTSGRGTVVTEPTTEETEEAEDSVVSLGAANEEFVAKFAAIGEGQSIWTPFAEETQEAARALCATADNMSLIEASAISIDTALYQGGPLTVTLDYDEDFNQFNDVLVVICANNNEYVNEPEVTEEGDLKLEIAEEVINNIIADANACLAIFAD